MISKEAKKQIDKWISKYPKNRKSSAVMEALKIVEKENDGYLNSKLIKTIAQYLDMPVIQVQEVYSFYENYNHHPTGKHVIKFCHSISCMLNGSDELISYMEDKIKAKVGQISKDGKISIKKVECLGACIGAPMCQIDEQYHENLNKEKIDKILENLK